MGRFCTKCGKPYNEGAKFCSGCGSPLVTARQQIQPSENQSDLVEIQKSNAEEQTEQDVIVNSGDNTQSGYQNRERPYEQSQDSYQGNSNRRQYQINFSVPEDNDFIEVIKNCFAIIIKPAKGIKEFMEKREKNQVYITLSIFGVLQSLLYLWFMRKLYKGIFSGANSILSEILGGGKNYLGSYLSMSNGRFFVEGLVISAIAIFGIILGLHILNSNNDPLIKVKIVTVGAIQITTGAFVCILLSYLVPIIAIPAYIFVYASVFIAFVDNIQRYLTDGRIMVYQVALILMIVFIVEILAIFILSIIFAFQMAGSLIQIFEQ